MTGKKIFIFDFHSYKLFLLAICGGKAIRRGIKARLAIAAECQPTYISQVLHGKAHLSPEQAERLGRFFNLSDEESQFFLLLLHKDRAGTKELKSFYSRQIEAKIVQRMNVVNRLGANNVLSEAQQAIFYSSWQYLAIHMALTVPEIRTREAIASYFNMDCARVDKILEFLLQTGLATENHGIYQTGTPTIRLGKDSPHIFRHHSHWRHQAIESLENETPMDLHYSAVVTLSKSDVNKLKDRLLDQIKENIEIIKNSKEEQVFVFNLDFFGLKKQQR